MNVNEEREDGHSSLGTEQAEILKQKMTLYFYLLVFLESERARERERERFVVPLISAFIGRFLYVP